jgi:hypothetical protein
MDPPRARPPIFKIALSFLAQLVYRAWMLSKRKTVEIRLWEFEWDDPYCVRRRYSHVLFRMVEPLRKGEGRTNIMATLGRTLGPFGDARAAYEAADQAGLKLGLTVEELEVYMTRERRIVKGPRKGELETRVVPVALFELLDVHETRNFKCADGQCNQAGFLPHKYTPRGAHHLETRFRYRRSGVARWRVAWRGVAWRGVAWCGVAWRGVAWRGVAWRGVARRGVALRGVTRRGVARRGTAWRGEAWRGVVGRGVARRGAAWRGVAWRQQTDRQTDRP